MFEYLALVFVILLIILILLIIIIPQAAKNECWGSDISAFHGGDDQPRIRQCSGPRGLPVKTNCAIGV